MDLRDIRLNCGLDLEEYYVRSDKYNQLADNYVKIARENAELREENARLIRAVDNLDTANVKISNELCEARWELIRTQAQLRKLTEISVDVEVEKNDGEENDRGHGENGGPGWQDGKQPG